jgi:hypothetical protein
VCVCVCLLCQVEAVAIRTSTPPSQCSVSLIYSRPHLQGQEREDPGFGIWQRIAFLLIELQMLHSFSLATNVPTMQCRSRSCCKERKGCKYECWVSEKQLGVRRGLWSDSKKELFFFLSLTTTKVSPCSFRYLHVLCNASEPVFQCAISRDCYCKLQGYVPSL